MIMKKLLMAFAITTLSLFLIACEDEPETPGEKLDQVVEETGDALEDAGDSVKDTAEDVGNSVEDACEDVKEGVDAKDTDC